jgi:hypothetical protein
MNRALRIAENLAPGERAVVLTPFWPAPLFEALDALGIAHRATMRADGGCEIYLWPDHGTD